ncbi:hypothetical protein [Celeribacter halophilus]|uniref:hypothetical protein n=1 Tax=Celeribacter halophilus TaxID=576117 RepID=UPI000832AD50|nr:hypothetical protein [Celeribacter halophilus]
MTVERTANLLGRMLLMLPDMGAELPSGGGDKVDQWKLAELFGVSTMKIKTAKRRSFVKLPRTELAQEVLGEIADALCSDPPCGSSAVFEEEAFCDV